MDYYKKHRIFYTVFTVLLISMYTIFYFKYRNKNAEFKTIKYETIKSNPEIDLNDSILLNYMLLLEIKYPHIVLKQAKLETGNYTSNRFKKYNALFGFQTSDTNIIKYKSWKESVVHYKYWQMKKLRTNEDYHKFLIRIKYAKDSLYINKLKQF